MLDSAESVKIAPPSLDVQLTKDDRLTISLALYWLPYRGLGEGAGDTKVEGAPVGAGIGTSVGADVGAP